MDLNFLLNILLKRKWLILSVILVSSIATWFLIGQLPETYKSKSVVETGIITYKGPTLQKDPTFIQQFQIESKFSGLIEMMRSRSVIKAVTNDLLSHDLLVEGTEQPFRIPDQEELELSPDEVDNIVMKLKTNLEDSVGSEEAVSTKSDAKLAKAYGYDFESLMKKMEINRIGETDYLTVEFDSENPELSHFVVKSFWENFSNWYENDLSEDEVTVLKFNRKKLVQVRSELDSVVKKINGYKTKHGLIDVTKQRETVISQKKDLEEKLQEVVGSIPSLVKNITYLESQIYEYNKRTSDDAYAQLRSNKNFAELDDEISILQGKIIDAKVAGRKGVSGMERRLEGLKESRAEALEKTISIIPSSEREMIDDKYKDLIKRQLDLKLDLELARQAQTSYNTEIRRLAVRADKLLIDDNYLYGMISEKDRLDMEYEKIRYEMEESEYLADGTESPLKVVEKAEVPDEPESKNRTVFSAFAGVAGGTLTSIFLFLLAFMDTSIQMPSLFTKATNLPLIGYVNKVEMKKMDLQKLFSQPQKKKELEFFKENIRKIRAAMEGSGAKTFLFVSPKEQEGKSFVILLLAYALGLSDKKVLIVDTNFKNNTISGFKGKPRFEISTQKEKAGFFGRKQNGNGNVHKQDPNLNNIDIVGNKGGSQSPSEVLAGKDFGRVIEAYKRKYDFIFMEAAAMNQYSDARELLPYIEKLAVVFSAESPIGNNDKDTLEYLRNMNGKMFGGIHNNVDLKNI